MRTIDADVLQAAFEMDGYKSPYVARMINSCPTVKAQAEWISVKDRLPEEEKEVLCYLGNSLAKSTVVAFRRRGEWYFDGWICPTVTHWRPLPEAPKEEK